MGLMPRSKAQSYLIGGHIGIRVDQGCISSDHERDHNPELEGGGRLGTECIPTAIWMH